MKVLLFLCFLLSLAQADAPFWKRKDVYDTLVEKKQVAVSAKAVQEETEASMSVEAAGIVNAPLAFTFETVQQYDKLKEISSYFHESKYDATKKQLYVHMSAMGYHARMTLKLEEKEEREPRAHMIHFECIQGNFLGMKGVIRLEDFQKRKTEMSLKTDYKTDKLPLPKALMGFGLEVVARKVAELMRSYIEDEHQKLLKKVPPK
ncbi:MAG: SRPBCC family protein [Bdellovibrionales bacterium]